MSETHPRAEARYGTWFWLNAVWYILLWPLSLVHAIFSKKFSLSTLVMWAFYLVAVGVPLYYGLYFMAAVIYVLIMVLLAALIYTDPRVRKDRAR